MAQALGLGPIPSKDAKSASVSHYGRVDFKRVSVVFTVISTVVAFVVLLGWFFEYIPVIRLIPGMPAMSAWNALGFMIAAGAIFGLQEVRRDHWTYRCALILGWGLILFSICGIINFEMVDYRSIDFYTSTSTSVNPVHMPLNRMTPNTAMTFLLLGIALLLTDKPVQFRGRKIEHWPFQILACAVAFEGVVTFIGSIFGVTKLAGFSHLIGMAAQASGMFVMLSMALLLARPNRGMVAVLFADSLPGRSARRLLPIAIVAPLVLGCVTLLVIRIHNPNVYLFAWLLIVFGMMVLAAMVWGTIMALYKQVEISQAYEKQIAELERHQVEMDLRSTEERLDFAVSGAGLGTWHWDFQSGRLLWSDHFKKLHGFAENAEPSYSRLIEAIHPDDRASVDEHQNLAIEGRESYSVEYRVVWPDRSVHWLSALGRVKYARDRVPISLEGIVQDITESRAATERQQALLRDVLSSVTDGRLILCLDASELPKQLSAMSRLIPLSRDDGVAELRRWTRKASDRVGLVEDQSFDMETAVGEAAMNAIVHANAGTGQVFVGESGTVQVAVVDCGAGISLENLPNATLRKGFTTAGTLGQGMKMMLHTADRVYILTGNAGTTVVLEKDAHPVAVKRDANAGRVVA
jgi:anti-sigma regulatory factor (Ser/Thr protein kinase)/PAS domain-containing protein